eukprot:symbB.v1.2.035027.t1/scaffold4633.1/size37115/2
MLLYNCIQLAFKKYKKSLLTNVSGSHHSTTAMKIAVVGAGLGGCSAARFCREEFPDAEIHVFERDRVGGRARVFQHAGHSYEAGASIIHEQNQYLSDFADEFQLEKLTPPSTRLCLHNGQSPVFEGCDLKWKTLLQLLWRYGRSPLKLDNWVGQFLRKFERIYGLQEASKAFTSPQKLLQACDAAFPPMLYETLQKRLERDGFSGNIVHELVEGMVRINYGQGLDVGSFVGPLWAVKGGNHLLAEKLLKSASAEVIHGKVQEIHASKGRYSIRVQMPDKELVQEFRGGEYDLVFLAAPQRKPCEIQILPELSSDIGRSYQRIYASFYTTSPRSSALGCWNDSAGGTILSTSSEAEFNSIGQYDSTLGNDFAIWKAFSKAPIDLEKPTALFPKDSHCDTFAWWAYPVYETSDERGRDVPFCLDGHGLFYCNAIEGTASAMEMAIIGAKTVFF